MRCEACRFLCVPDGDQINKYKLGMVNPFSDCRDELNPKQQGEIVEIGTKAHGPKTNKYHI
jgi:hypothetical protein